MISKPCFAGPWDGDETAVLGNLCFRVLLPANEARHRKIAIPWGGPAMHGGFAAISCLNN